MNAGKYFYYKDSNGNYVELTSLEVPNSITSIGKYQFYGFDHLKSVVIGSHVETIGINAFNFCTSLSEITIKEGLKNINNGAFSDCIAIKQITLPNCLETLGERVFYNCSGLTSIVLPEGIVSIEQYGTAMSNNIANIYYMGSEEQWNEVVIGTANPSFSTATIYYNYVVE